MILVAANFVIKEGKQVDFLQAANLCIKETRKESGNVFYNLLNDTENKLKFSFIEGWKSQADLHSHTESAHFIELIKSTKDMLMQELDVKIYKAIDI